MNNQTRQSKITDLMALMVFCLFALCILAVLLTGAAGYRKLVDRGSRDYDRRTAAQYVATRVRQADRAGCVALEDFGGAEALVFREEIGGAVYLTRVYCHDGFIRELFAPESGNFSPEDGEKLLAAQSLSFSLEGDLLSAEIRFSDGTNQFLTLYLRAGEEDAP